jgi:hypothetical protein
MMSCEAKGTDAIWTLDEGKVFPSEKLPPYECDRR